MAFPNVDCLKDSDISLVDDFDDNFEEEMVIKVKFEKEIGIVVSYIKQGTYKKVFLEAIKAEVIPAMESFTPRHILALARWCKSEAGKKEVKEITQVMKLQKKTTTELSLSDLAVTSLLNQQLTDLSFAKKQVLDKQEEKIRKLTRSIEKQRQKMAAELEAVGEQNEPASQYKIPTYNEILGKCWEDWVPSVVAGRHPAPAMSQENFLKCVEECGPVYVQQHKAAFCQDEQRKKQLEQYGKEKVQAFRGAFDVCAAYGSHNYN